MAKLESMMAKKTLETLRKNPVLLLMLFWDGEKTCKNHEEFKLPQDVEKGEKGYFKALINTFLEEIQKDKIEKLDPDSITRLHTKSTKNVQNLLDHIGEKVNTNFTNHGHQKFWGLINFENMKSYVDHQKLMHGLLTDEEIEEDYYSMYVSPGLLVDFDKYKARQQDDPSKKFVVWFENILTTERNKQIVGKILEDYNTKIKTCTTEKEKIACIVDMVQPLERLHPFGDGNCRTFCMMLLNLELIRNGLEPTLQDNPNHFDITPADKLVERIISGQNRFKSVVEDSKNIYSLTFTDFFGKKFDIDPNWIADAELLINAADLIEAEDNPVELDPDPMNIYHKKNF